MSEKRTRRAHGEGSVYLQRPGSTIWWLSYNGPDGRRKHESSGSTQKSYALRLLRKRTGAREHNLPVIQNAEKLTFDQAALAVISDYKVNGKRSQRVVERRIEKHLKPYFTGRRMAGITAADVTAYVVHRQVQGIVTAKGVRRADVSNGEINRELAILKRIFNLAIKGGKLGMKPHIAMLRENNVRKGFFDREQFAAVLRHMPDDLRGVVEFAGITGWRMASEVLTLEWRQVDLSAGEVRLDAGATKNGEGRVFPITTDLRRVLLARQAEHDRLKKAGHIEPLVFFREVAEGRGGPKKPRKITSLTKAWRAACKLAGCPGRILHDLRRSAVRNLDRAGISRDVAMQMVGHKTDSIYRRYRIVDTQDLLEAARRLDGVTTTAAAG
jgi:integrase